MRNNCTRLFAAAALLSLGSSGWGQSSDAETLKGELHTAFPTIARNAVTLTDVQNRYAKLLADIAPDGTFEFHHVPYGQYYLTLLDDGNREIYHTLVSVQQMTPRIMIDVAADSTAPTASGAASQPVSMVQLMHPPAKKAVEAFRSAQKYIATGQTGKAEETLETAVQISPYYADAYISLAVQHIRSGRFQQALDELQHAGKIVKPTAMILGGMAYAQYGLQHYDDSRRSARLAIQLDPSYAPAHYILGSLLGRNPATLSEAVPHLEEAAKTMPAAQENLERVRRNLTRAVAQR